MLKFDDTIISDPIRRREFLPERQLAPVRQDDSDYANFRFTRRNYKTMPIEGFRKGGKVKRTKRAQKQKQKQKQKQSVVVNVNTTKNSKSIRRASTEGKRAQQQPNFTLLPTTQTYITNYTNPNEFKLPGSQPNINQHSNIINDVSLKDQILPKSSKTTEEQVIEEIKSVGSSSVSSSSSAVSEISEAASKGQIPPAPDLDDWVEEKRGVGSAVSSAVGSTGTFTFIDPSSGVKKTWADTPSTRGRAANLLAAAAKPSSLMALKKPTDMLESITAFDKTKLKTHKKKTVPVSDEENKSDSVSETLRKRLMARRKNVIDD